MSDPFAPIPEVRKHQARNFVDEHGDTWDPTGTIKIGVRNPNKVLAEHDSAREALRAALDAEGIRDRTVKETIIIDGQPVEVEMLPPGDQGANIMQIEVFPDSDQAIRNATHRTAIKENPAYRKLVRMDDGPQVFPVSAKDLQNERDLGAEELNYLMEKLYREGGSPDLVCITLELARETGLIGPWEYRWRKFKRSVGIWTRSVISGVRSVRRTRGTRRTARR